MLAITMSMPAVPVSSVSAVPVSSSCAVQDSRRSAVPGSSSLSCVLSLAGLAGLMRRPGLVFVGSFG